MEYQDKTIACKDCGTEFTFTASEQEFYASKGFQNEPARCPDCRAKFKEQRRENRQMFDATCAECGAATQVPFQPTEGRPVYCMDCFKAKNPR
ncbi:MAG: zinc-binding protein [Candidatus Woykebacteria bacterium RIFCSPHIGHO2_12_FULL_43_10]|uniref:Zinc-binding protein n=1 Tax=Candidatus Woykebacteria bacterium RIFCSPHIGHO2_02_FULL_43_16b TaxID=1802601 RepID=A0A1G1WMD8_9BACT|nr:MAG: zinc-binding protein [Candidatus Woykebacteria bacterium RIFCSPHIGHO2_02_FULL_43_16b]OGY29429.1 MAG: zinc-binding protein [Candidatus Woykebacteria bacterium RIFCSPHIGHO2_12_FULL_43_10]